MTTPLQGDSTSLGTPGVTGSNTATGAGPVIIPGSPVNAAGVYGNSLKGDGVSGTTPDPNHAGVHGANSGTGIGVKGESTNGHGTYGITGDPNHNGANGIHTGSGNGVYGNSANGNGVHGVTGNPNMSGVFGEHTGGGNGVYGTSVSGNAVAGHSSTGNAGFFNGHVLHNGDVTTTGTHTVNGDIVLTNAADCAEEFDITDPRGIEPGTVMVLDRHGAVRISQQAYDKKVAGVISGAGGYRPGLILDKRGASTPGRKPIALFGKVYCKVDAQYGPIEIGDLLTTSPTPGHAMKAEDSTRAFGTVLGKALHPIAEGEGLIPVLVTLQ